MRSWISLPQIWPLILIFELLATRALPAQADSMLHLERSVSLDLKTDAWPVSPQLTGVSLQDAVPRTGADVHPAEQSHMGVGIELRWGGESLRVPANEPSPRR